MKLNRIKTVLAEKDLSQKNGSQNNLGKVSALTNAYFRKRQQLNLNTLYKIAACRTKRLDC